MKQKLLGIYIEKESKKDILEKIEKYLKNPKGFFHIVSLNPENMVIAQKLRPFKEIINKAQVRIVDGVGIVVTGQMLGVEMGSRLPGVDLMEKLLLVASKRRLRVAFIGGKGNLAEELASCYNHAYPTANFLGFQGIAKINNPNKNEEKKLFSIVTDYKPHFLFVAFGSPDQELWLYKNRALLQGIVCMGVGGGFDFLAKKVRRAPNILRNLGLEWLFRLVIQPWRIKRQFTRLPYFIWLVVKERFYPTTSD